MELAKQVTSLEAEPRKLTEYWYECPHCEWACNDSWYTEEWIFIPGTFSENKRDAWKALTNKTKEWYKCKYCWWLVKKPQWR